MNGETAIFGLYYKEAFSSFLTCADFGNYSPLRLNEEKSGASWIGRNKFNTSKPLQCKWVNLTSDKIKILGSYSSYCKDLSEKHNFLKVINKLKTCLHVWKSRELTLAEKILIFKPMALSKILYISTMKVPSKLVLEELDPIQKEFIWDSKRPKIKRSILIADYSEGGYKNVDVKSKLMSLKLIWIKRLLDDNFHTWKHLAKIFLIPLGSVFLFHSNLSLSDRCLHTLIKLPTFYQELINLWTKTCSTEPKNMAEILGQSLWNNRFIRCKDKPIFYRQFSDRGINTISDLITEDRKFLRWSQAYYKYQLSNKDAMKWLGLIESIPRDWKSFIKNESNGFNRTYSISNDIRVLDKTIPLQAITSRIAYTLLTKPLIEKSTAQIKVHIRFI